MFCDKCGAKIDYKFKECPICNEKIGLKKRLREQREIKTYSRNHPKNVWANEKISGKREAEERKAYFGRKKRTEQVRTSNFIIYAIAAALIMIIFSAGIYDKYIKNNLGNENVMAQSENGDSNSNIELKATSTDAEQNKATPTEAISDRATPTESIEDNSSDGVSNLPDKEVDRLAAEGIYKLSSDIIKNGKKKYKQGYKRQLLNNKGKAVVLSEEIRKDEKSDVYDYIMDTLGDDSLKIRYRDNGAEYYSIYVDDKNLVYIYAATKENPMAYALCPDIDASYNSD